MTCCSLYHVENLLSVTEATLSLQTIMVKCGAVILFGTINCKAFSVILKV